jgi:hypothetical protein
MMAIAAGSQHTAPARPFPACRGSGTGELDAVLDGLREAFRAAAQAGPVVMTVTLSNACPAGA